MSQAPILFLDFDGVLHPGKLACLDVFEGGRVMVNRSVDEVMIFLPILTSILAQFPEFKIIVSSTWRRQHTEVELANLLGPLGDRVTGTLFKDRLYLSRLHEILAFVDLHKIQHWVALDDDIPLEDDLLEQHGGHVANRCVKTYPDLGLGWSESQTELLVKLRSVRNDWRNDYMPNGTTERNHEVR